MVRRTKRDPDVPTPGQQLANSRRIAAQNAALYDIAAGALREVRELAEMWRMLKTSPRYGADVVERIRLELCAEDTEAIIDRYDAAITEVIK